MDWLLNVPGDALLYIVKDGVDYKTTKDALLSSFGIGLFVPEGLSMSINRPILWIQDNFEMDDTSPNYLLGKNNMVGWRIKLQNGGRVSVGWHPTDYPTLGATGGEEQHTLTIPELPVVTPEGGTSIHKGGGSGSGGLTADDGNGGPFGPGEFIKPFGGGNAHNNMQPYIVELHIERAFDAFVGGGGNRGHRILSGATQTIQSDDVLKDLILDNLDEIVVDPALFSQEDSYVKLNAFNKKGKITFINGAEASCFGQNGLTEINYSKGDDILIINIGNIGLYYVIITNKSNVFRCQVTQSGTSAPEIVAGTLEGNYGAVFTSNYDYAGKYTFTSDLPIFANVKQFYKNSTFTDIRIIGFLVAGSPIGAWSYKVVSDYAFEIISVNDFYSLTLSDDVLNEPQQIEIEL
ncbi:hypothetical protein [Flavobacterium sp.]|uniref:hypothetical protein n=1 Tax=Flavobacterium sp. TaxID=239 RepID=UPI00261F21D2|nr:hypothetical protein [Flavobacterium sp.]